MLYGQLWMILAYLVAVPAYGFADTVIDAVKIVDAIKIVEGVNSRYPYGIKSIPCSGQAECRRICQNTVKNTFKRWLRAGKPGDYLDYLADRYCPASVDPQGNKNWKRNIHKILKDKD